MPRAYFRQGQAYRELKETRKARRAFIRAAALGESHSELAGFLAECRDVLGAEGEEEERAQFAAERAAGAGHEAAAGSSAMAESEPAAEPAVRTDWFQRDDRLSVEIYIKRAKKEEVSVSITATTVEVAAKTPAGGDYALKLALCHTVDPAESDFRVMGTKIEVRLKKKFATKWAALEGEGTDGSEVLAAPMGTPAAAAEAAAKRPAGYEQQQRWDALAAQAEKEEKEEKLEGDAALNQLFQNIYKDADPETQRAMNKSFQESNGTVLSTNWAEIGKEKTETKPPSGMEFKKYES